MAICQTDRLYHYLLAGEAVLDSILQHGLLPLSDLPPSERSQQLSAFYQNLYTALAEPVLQKPYINSGVFLTPIDFRQLPGSALAGRTRVAVPLDAIMPGTAVLTYEWSGERIVIECTPGALQEVAQEWSADLVQSWFGRNPSMLFFHVPQVGVYQPGGIPVRPEWVERGPGEVGRPCCPS